MKLARFWLVHIPNLHLEVLFRCSVLLDPCQYVLSSVNFIFCNQESFQTNLCTHNINTRNKHHLRRPNANLSFYYPDQQMHNIYINNIVYIVSSPTCFNASASSFRESEPCSLLKLQKLFEITTQ